MTSGAARARPLNPDSPILLHADAWEPSFCRRIRDAMARGDAAPGEILDGAFVVDRGVRDVLDVEVDDATLDAVARAVAAARDPVASFFGLTLTRSEGPGFLRYNRGDFYRRHLDRADRAAAMGDRLVSLVCFLNTAGDEPDEGGLAGGLLRLYPGPTGPPFDVPPRAGTLVAFPASLPHEVLPVLRGVREVVVDWYS